MKNVYLYIMFLLTCFSSFGQDLQNANWLFGKNTWLTFSSSTTVALSGSVMDNKEVCASVSDENGNLLFYTNGSTVWNSIHQPMTNGNNTLYGYNSNTQGAVIVPKPGNKERYYVFTIDGFSGTKKGLYYSEVDMSNGYGQVVSLNTKLKDHNAVYIDNNYFNVSEKLSSCTHSNGVDYWLVTQIAGYVYSYKVTSTGIGIGGIPNSYTVAPVDMVDRGNGGGSPGIGNLKISPNNQRIAIAYESKVRLEVPVGQEEDTFAYGALVVGNFNNSTGQVVLNTLKKYPNMYVYGVEFSPNSQNIFFTNNMPGQNASGLFVTTSNLSHSIVNNTLPGNNGAAGLQRAINGKIYMTKGIDPIPQNKMSFINNPNNFSAPDLQLDTVDLGSGKNSLGLPQWVHWQETCPSDLVLTSTVFDVLASAQDNRQASNTITASNVINNGAVGIYHAGEDIVFKPGFSSANGSVFRAYIEGCSNEFEGLRTSGEEESSRTVAFEEESEKELFTLYPNPAVTSVTITSDKVMQNITVTSLDGFTLFQGTIKANSYELYINDYRKGVYVITVTTDDGEMEMKKLIKE